MWKWLTDRASSYRRNFTEIIPSPEGEDYLVRRHLVKFPKAKAYLHHILISDADRHLHDHPWDFIIIVLWGGYYEHRPGGVKKWRGPGSIVLRRAGDFHRVELPEGKTSWSLCFCGPKRKDRSKELSVWGFQTEKGWVDSVTYIRGLEGEQNPPVHL